MNIFRKLHTDFQSFPHQAVHCCLANVEPLGESWTDEANALLGSFVEARELRAKRISIPSNSQQLSEVLVEVCEMCIEF